MVHFMKSMKSINMENSSNKEQQLNEWQAISEENEPWNYSFFMLEIQLNWEYVSILTSALFNPTKVLQNFSYKKP